MEQGFLLAWQMMQMMQMDQLRQHQYGMDHGNPGLPPFTEAIPSQMAQIPEAPDQSEPTPVRCRSRSRSPYSRGSCTSEVATPEALQPISPARPSSDGHPPTPEIVRRLLAITSEDDPNTTRAQAVERLGDLARQAKSRMDEQQARDQPTAFAHHVHTRPLGNPHFQPDDIQKAREAIGALSQDIIQACKGRSASAQASLQLNVKFVEPVPSAADLAARIQGLLGAKGPLVNVQPLEASSWRKPSAHTWFAEKKGDNRNCVFRVNIPPDSSHRKARHLSFQVAVGGRELMIKGNKSVLQQYGSNVILMFGPHRAVEAAKTQEANTRLDDFWGAR